jgi:glycerol uptake facilitator-like aquaporin
VFIVCGADVQDAALEPPKFSYGAAKRLVAEGLGTTLLVAVVIGSGVMAERLAAGNVAVALLANAIATGAALAVLITVFGPISGAHFNPVVSLAFAIRRELPLTTLFGFVLVQIAGAYVGAIIAHAMFNLSLVQVSTHVRGGPAQAFSEAVATFGLLLTIFGALRFRPSATPAAVGLYITAAYWFTASTSFANPAVTVARTLTDTFAGIAPASAPIFILAQIVGMAAAVGMTSWLFTEDRARV